MRFVAKIQIRIFNPKTEYWSKWSTTEVDSLDHTQNWILWIHDPRRFFTTDPKSVNIASGNPKLNTFNAWHRSAFWQDFLSLRPFLQSILPVLSGGKIDLHNPIVLVTTKKTTIHNFAGAYYKTLLFNYISYFNYPKANRPEYNERSSNLQPCHQQPCCSFSGIPSILWVVSMEMNEK